MSEENNEATNNGNTNNENNEEVRDPKAVLSELRRAQEDLRNLRAENESLKSAAENNGNDEWKQRAIKAEVKVALANQGIKDVDRLVPYVGTEGISFDEEGNLDGLDDRLETLKGDLPELFDPKRRVGGKGDIFAESNVNETKDASDIQARSLLGT